MIKNFFKNSELRKIFILLLIIFILTEIIDLLLDSIFGNSLLHSILQFVLFVFLFLITYSFFVSYQENKMKKLIPSELMEILKIIKESNKKGILINHRKMREKLNVTKPTLKKRIDALLELDYLSFKEKGNHKYFNLTKKGESVIF